MVRPDTWLWRLWQAENANPGSATMKGLMLSMLSPITRRSRKGNGNARKPTEISSQLSLRVGASRQYLRAKFEMQVSVGISTIDGGVFRRVSEPWDRAKGP